MDDNTLRLRQAMYQHEDDGQSLSPQAEPTMNASGLGKIQRIVIGAVAIDVPSMAYVEHLERSFADCRRELAEQKHAIARLQAAVNQLRHALRANAGHINDLSREMDQKIDRRD